LATRAPTWEAARARRFVAKEHEVERTGSGFIRADRIQHCGGGRLGIPFDAVRLQMDRAVDAKGHRVAELFDGFCGPQRQDHRLAAVRLDQPHSLFDAALLRAG